jgi:hypothetical protein
MRNLFLLTLLLPNTFPATGALAQSASSLWDHNGSIVSLSANGAGRQFYYQSPRSGLAQVGVQSGTLLFEGRKDGSSYSGTAYIFNRKCGRRGYSVSGPVSEDQQNVTMYGKAPLLDPSCRIVGYRDDMLVFVFRGSSEQRIAAAPPPGPAVQDTRRELICMHPVFTEEYKLRATIDGSPSRTDYVAAAINYLRVKYCRQIDGNAIQELNSDQDTHIGDNC